MKYMAIILFLALLLLLLCGTWYLAHASEFEFDLQNTPVTVVDGDTFRVGETSYRLNGADAPERGQPGYREASTELALMIANGQEMICVQVGESYKRPVVRCKIDGQDVAYRLISLGLTHHDSRFTSGAYRMQLSMAEVSAWMQGMGVWKNPNVVEPKDWRENH